MTGAVIGSALSHHGDRYYYDSGPYYTTYDYGPVYDRPYYDDDDYWYWRRHHRVEVYDY